MTRLIEYKINKYVKYVDNLRWHIDTNKPDGEELKSLQKRILTYREILEDLRELKSSSTKIKI